MNKSGYSEGDVTGLDVNRLATVLLVVMAVAVSVFVGQAHGQALRTVEQQIIQAEDLEVEPGEIEPGADPSVTQQSSDETEDPESAAVPVRPASNLTREQFMEMLASEVILAPGVGLQHIRLGEPLGSVKSRLGPPRSVSRSGFLPRYTILTYLLDGGTTVQLVGRKVIERIRVIGNSAALIRTAQGARFGMNPTLIQRIYRAPTKQRRNRLEYRNRGITFYFAEQGGGQSLSDGVSRIEIYRPGARGSS